MNDDTGPPYKKEIIVKVDVFKTWKLIQRWMRRKDEVKRCEESNFKTSNRGE